MWKLTEIKTKRLFFDNEIYRHFWWNFGWELILKRLKTEQDWCFFRRSNRVNDEYDMHTTHCIFFSV